MQHLQRKDIVVIAIVERDHEVFAAGLEPLDHLSGRHDRVAGFQHRLDKLAKALHRDVLVRRQRRMVGRFLVQRVQQDRGRMIGSNRLIGTRSHANVVDGFQSALDEFSEHALFFRLWRMVVQSQAHPT